MKRDPLHSHPFFRATVLPAAIGIVAFQLISIVLSGKNPEPTGKVIAQESRVCSLADTGWDIAKR